MTFSSELSLPPPSAGALYFFPSVIILFLAAICT